MLADGIKETALSPLADVACPSPAPFNIQGQKNINQAVNDLKKAVSFNPRLSYSYFLLGRASCLSARYPEAVKAFWEYSQLRPNNPLGHIELALAYEADCFAGEINGISSISSTLTGKKLALTCTNLKIQSNIHSELEAAGITSETLAQVGNVEAEAGRFDSAVLWYQRALLLKKDNSIAIKGLGNICEKRLEQTNLDVCAVFLANHANNWFMDDQLSFPLFNYWQPYERTEQTIYDITDCPGIPGKKCATFSMKAGVIDGVGLFQCIPVEPGKQYRFSAWLKVSTNAEGTWRPLYVQGSIGGNPVGSWYSNTYQTGTKDWFFLQYTFAAPNYDQHTACLHPIRLQSEGQAWFYNPSLELVQEQP